jgi:hypothetical protein
LAVGCDLQVDAAEATLEAVRAARGTKVSLEPCHLSRPPQLDLHAIQPGGWKLPVLRENTHGGIALFVLVENLQPLAPGLAFTLPVQFSPLIKRCKASVFNVLSGANV